MQPSIIFHSVPLWALFVLTVLIVLFSVEAGYQVGRLRARRDANEKDAPLGGLVGATLGLLAFLLAFTFGAASTRYDARKQVVLQEANAIGTAYLRADFLPGPQRTDARDALVAYATLRAQGITVLMQPEIIAQSSALLDKLWSVTAAVGNQSPNSPTAALFVQAVNDVIDLDSSRLTAGRNVIPDFIWFVLYAVTVVTMAAMGYQFGLTGKRSWAETILLVVAFSLVILLIADLDRPQSGAINVSQQPILDLLDKITTPAP